MCYGYRCHRQTSIPSRFEKLNTTNKVLGQIVELMAANTKKMGVLGAQVMVLGKFLEAVLPHLTTSNAPRSPGHSGRALKRPCH